MLGSLWLIPILCLAGAIVNLLLGAIKAPKPVVTVVGVGSVGAATVATYAALLEYLRQPHSEIIERYFTWISAGEISVNASLQLDPLSAVMVAFVTFVGFLIHVYSVGYMHEETDEGYARYFAYLNLFMFAMLLLVLGSNLPVLFVGWEGVGLCSYLLIGYYYEQEWCAAAGSKAFIVNRIGDLGFLLAIFATIAVFGSVEFSEIFASAASHPSEYAGAATIIALLLFVGAIGKSAQIPLYVWLPDAMAGPTPVSALIHAATMVTAGVYIEWSAVSRPSSPQPSDWSRTTSRRCSPTRRFPSSATCSSRPGSAPSRRRSSTSSPTPSSRPVSSSLPAR
jgi:NADH-quinone oxidoreductase subunit L